MRIMKSLGDEHEHFDEALSPLDDLGLKLLLENHAKFIKFLSSRVGSDAVAEDLLQQGLLRALQHKNQLNTNTNVIAWFYTVLRNILIDYHRSQAATERKHEKFFEELTVSGDNHSPSETEFGKEVCACMGLLIPLLRPSYAEILQKVDLAGQPVEVVATELNISAGNLTVRLHRARQALRKSLELFCGACSKHGCLDCTCK